MGCDVDLAWCAGFLDGEGSFMLVNVQHTGRRRAYLSADQIYSAPLEKLARVLGGRFSGPVSKTSAGNPIYRWHMAGTAQIRLVLPTLIPYLTIKRERAELILRHAQTHGTRGTRLTPEKLAERVEIEREFVLLSGRT